MSTISRVTALDIKSMHLNMNYNVSEDSTDLLSLVVRQGGFVGEVSVPFVRDIDNQQVDVVRCYGWRILRDNSVCVLRQKLDQTVITNCLKVILMICILNYLHPNSRINWNSKISITFIWLYGFKIYIIEKFLFSF